LGGVEGWGGGPGSEKNHTTDEEEREKKQREREEGNITHWIWPGANHGVLPLVLPDRGRGRLRNVTTTNIYVRGKKA